MGKDMLSIFLITVLTWTTTRSGQPPLRRDLLPEPDGIAADDDDGVGRALQTLLGFPAKSLTPGSAIGHFDSRLAPQYMLDLYERYKDGRIRSGGQVANTVRSIQAERGECHP